MTAVGAPAPPRAADSRADTGAVAAWTKFVVGFLLVGFLAFMVSGDEYWLGLATTGLLFAGLASAWNIIGGLGGQFSLGHGVFFATGAYAVALLQVKSGWSAAAALVVGAVLAGLVGLLLAAPVFRLRGPFLAIGTLALNQVALALANYFDWTGGPQGVRIPFQDALVSDALSWMWVMYLFAAGCTAIALLISRGRLGYYLVAVREDEDAADAAGANPLVVKSVALLISAVLTGIGGGLFASFIGFVDPQSVLNIAEIGARIPLLALIGGLGTIAGPVIGALVVQPGEMYLRGELSSAPPGISLIVVGALFVLAARFFRRGVWGSLTEAIERYRGRR